MKPSHPDPASVQWSVVSQSRAAVPEGELFAVHLSADGMVPRWGLWRWTDASTQPEMVYGMFGWNVAVADILREYLVVRSESTVPLMQSLAPADFVAVSTRSLPPLRGPVDSGTVFYGK